MNQSNWFHENPIITTEEKDLPPASQLLEYIQTLLTNATEL